MPNAAERAAARKRLRARYGPRYDQFLVDLRRVRHRWYARLFALLMAIPFLHAIVHVLARWLGFPCP